MLPDTPVTSSTFNPSLELIDWLRMLLRAERAGARLMLDSAGQTDDPGLLRRFAQLHHGEAESCRRLRHCLERLGVERGQGMGEFHAKAMAIPDLQARMEFIARGQRWVARQVQERLPALEPAWLRDELTVVLHLHQASPDA